MGCLNYIKIWHDNTGKGDKASWFLNYIIVHDLQTKQKYYFLCNDWLAVEHSDGKIERGLFVAYDKQKTELKYLINILSHEFFLFSYFLYLLLKNGLQEIKYIRI